MFFFRNGCATCNKVLLEPSKETAIDFGTATGEWESVEVPDYI
jgi:hypothetical protein